MKRVYILGSGFSTYAGAPLSRAVLPAIFSPEHQDTKITQLKDFLSDFLFRKEKNWVNTSGLEEVLSRLDLIRHYKPYAHVDYNNVSLFEELLIGEFIKLLNPENTNASRELYTDFGKLVKQNDVIISFNYDLVVEQLLKLCGKNYSYCIRPDELEMESVRLLKLHGSINLYYCPLCGEIYQFANRSKSFCGTCDNKGDSVSLRHFIIAPTLFKSYTLPVLRNLWFHALEALRDTDELYFIGYSMPEADILSYQLFDFGKRLAQKNQPVHLICGPRLNDGRFRQIYQNNLINTRIGFEQWIRTETRHRVEK